MLTSFKLSYYYTVVKSRKQEFFIHNDNAHFRDLLGSESFNPKAAAALHITVTSTGPKVNSVIFQPLPVQRLC